MTSLVRIRPYLRLAAFVAALCALMVPATAGASVHAHASKKKKAKPPVVTSVRPMTLSIGQTLEIRGKYFIRGRNKNSVAFKRDGGKAVFVKAKVGTTKLLRVTVPTKLEKEFTKIGTTVVDLLCDDGRTGTAVLLDGPTRSTGSGVLGDDQISVSISRSSF